MTERMTDERLAEYVEAAEMVPKHLRGVVEKFVFALKAEREFANEKVREIRMCFDEDLKMRTLKQQEERIAELEAQIHQLTSGRGPDDPSKCPAGNFSDCCGYHDACIEALNNG